MLEKITHNWSLKLLALAIAVTMWLFVAGQEKAEFTVEVPVELTKIPPQALVVNDVVSKIQVRLHGPSSLIRSVARRRLLKRVDLPNMGLGEHVFRLLPGDLALPAGVEVVRVNPASFTVVLEGKLSRKVPVSGGVKGKPAPGFEVAELTFKPSQVTVTGSAKDLAEVDWIWTAPVDVTGLKKDASVKVGLRLPRGRRLLLETSQVEAHVTIRPMGGQVEPKPMESAPAGPQLTGP